MIDYQERVDEVAHILSSEIGFEDRQAVDILLACQIPHPSRPPWLVVETDYYLLDLERAWFNFSGVEGQEAIALPALRTKRPRQSNLETAILLKTRDQPRLFTECNWQMPTKVVYQYSYWPYLQQECIRLRVMQPHGKLLGESALQRLRQAVERAIDPRWWKTAHNNPIVPGNLFYYAELLQRVNPTLRHWETLILNLTSLAIRRANLYDRPIDETDWEAVSRVMRDSVPDWNARIIRGFETKGRLTRLRSWLTPGQIKSQVAALVDQGVLSVYQGEWMLAQRESRGKDFLQLVNGTKLL